MSTEKITQTGRGQGKRPETKPRQTTAGKARTSPLAPQREKGHTSAAGVGILVFLAMTFFLIGSGAAVYFDLGGSKDKLAQILGIYSRVEAREAQAASRESEADKLKESLAAVQTAQEKEKASLEKQAADIEKSKAELEEERKQFKEQKLTDEQRQAELEKMGQALGQMDAAKAADIITKLGDTDQMVFLVRQLTPESSAQVLANMQPDLAAKILQKMISG